MNSTSRAGISFTFFALVAQAIVAPTTADEFESHIRTWDLPQKKTIEWDWETAFHPLEYLRTNVSSIERIPFDGLAIPINHEGKRYHDGLCHEVKWPEDEMQPVYEALAAIEWDAYQHNFIPAFAGEKHLGADSKEPMDWFDDAHWDMILHNIRLLTHAAVAGNCVGRRTPLIRPKSARIRHIAADAEPVIDGELSEAMWERAKELSGFTHLLHYTRGTLVGTTTARAVWNDEGLYIGFTCADPDIERLRENPDEQRKVNRLRMVIAADQDAASHYRLNFDMNGFVDMYAKADGEQTWNDPLTPGTTPSSAVAIGSDQWTAEWFIPWSCIGGKPEAGTSRKATLLRLRPWKSSTKPLRQISRPVLLSRHITVPPTVST